MAMGRIGGVLVCNETDIGHCMGMNGDCDMGRGHGNG